jgi:hypothetical protein
MRLALLISVLYYQTSFAQNEFRFNDCLTICSCQKSFLDEDSLVYKKEWLTNGNFDSVAFFDSKGTSFEAYIALTTTPIFDGGFESLNSFVKDNFTPREGIEANGKAYVMFTFRDNETDIRIIDRVGYTLRYYDYDSELKRVLNLVNDKWSLDHIETQLPVVFFYLFDVP